MKNPILPTKKEIITHSIALVLGFTIGYFVFTNTNYTEIENKTLELEKLKGELVEKENNLTPALMLSSEYEKAMSQIALLNTANNQLLNENKKLKNEKISNVVNYSDSELELFITEWAKRNGRLPQ